jgi:TonB family protein
VRREPNVFHWALIISVLLHILLLLLLPVARKVWPATPETLVQAIEAVEDQRPPLEFEFVDLAEDREEEADDPDAPLSDLDRRAHGGDGETSDQPSSQGNTRQLVQAQGADRLASGAPPTVPGPQVDPSQIPDPNRPQPEEFQPDEPSPEREPAPEGAGEVEPEPQPQTPRIKLPPPGVFTMPQDLGGLMENPDRDGGGVDTGSLSFDTQWYDWGPYAKAMLAKIRRNWDIPQLARMGVAGRVRIRYFIERDGTVTGMQILDESGKPPMDNAAFQAIAKSSPFRPLPVDLPGIEREGVTITFYYNSDPPSRGGR